MQAEVNGVIPGANHLTLAITRNHFHRKRRPDCGFGDTRSQCQLRVRRLGNDGIGAMF